MTKFLIKHSAVSSAHVLAHRINSTFIGSGHYYQTIIQERKLKPGEIKKKKNSCLKLH